MTFKFDNLVFEGGGVRGIAYAGALAELDDKGLLEDIQGVAGTSAGAFTALLLALGYSPEEMRKSLQSIKFEMLEDKPNPFRIVTHYGLYKGDVLFDWISDQLARKGTDPGLTFEQLAAEGGRHLKVFATDLNICNTREFSAHKTPSASIVGAVRASMSIPLMYAAWQFPDGVPDNHVYVDGGTVYNYPIDAFDTPEKVNTRTLGLCFKNLQEHRCPELGTDNLLEYARSLFSAVLNTQAIDFQQDIEAIRRSVLIDDLGYKATDLELSQEGFDQLYVSGRKAMAAFLEAGQVI